MRNKGYSLIVYPYAFGQFCVQLRSHAECAGEHGASDKYLIIRKLITTRINCVTWAVHRIATAEEPLEYTKTFERSDNVDPVTSNIDLDNL